MTNWTLIGLTCDASSGLDQRCGSCESIFFPDYEVTGELLCPDSALDILNQGGTLSDAPCTERECWDMAGNVTGMGPLKEWPLPSFLFQKEEE